ncbi:hypothetical protein AWE51_06445 [Aquimarina aggregata]|uniref:Uncharacterized protein n=1 Tax=Aquimarina aggregata TaxID=1642818 RepID=A0A163AJA7_9FLAO|nr:hypothetical protein [Aquimarina aggregata]KZS40582.1 hypothetical protein AWE51_06445 [Aquimarina aggregata]
MILTQTYLEKLGSDQILNLAEFIVTENFNHHSNQILPKDYRKDVRSIYDEEVTYYNNSEIYVTKDCIGSILGAIRVLRWNYVDTLPLQKIFRINPLLCINQTNINNIFHIGRFAIKKGVRDINLFKQLMVCAIAPVCQHKDNIVFAECDGKLLRILSLLGIKATIIGKSIDYLGSETIPIVMAYDGLIDFYNKNKSLASVRKSTPQVESSRLPKSVVFNTPAYNYSLV